MSEDDQSGNEKLEPKREGATKSEVLETYAGPAIYVNRFICTTNSAVRLSFLEVDGYTTPHYRTAVSMSLEDAYQLSKLLDKMLSETGFKPSKAGSGNG